MPESVGYVEGQVTRNGKPVAGATVMIADGPDHPDIAALTDNLGHYRFDDLTQGVYRLTVAVEGLEPQSKGVTVTMNTPRLDFAV